MTEIYFPKNGSRPLLLIGRRLPEGRIAGAVRHGVLEVSAAGEIAERIAVPLDRVPTVAQGLRVVELPPDDDLSRVRSGTLTQPLSAITDDVAAGGAVLVEPEPHDGSVKPRAPLFDRLKRLVVGTVAAVTVAIGVGLAIHHEAAPDTAVLASAPAKVEMTRTVDPASGASEIQWNKDYVQFADHAIGTSPRPSVDSPVPGSQSLDEMQLPSPSAGASTDVGPGDSVTSAFDVAAIDPAVSQDASSPVRSVPLPTVKPAPPMLDMTLPVNQAKSAIVAASMSTGAALPELLAIGEIESGFDFTAKASTSSATGIFQFTEQAWYSALKKWGHEHGAGHLADKIRPGKISGFTPINPADKQLILDARKDPVLNAALGAELTRENRSNLQARIGRPPSGGEIYISHFLGLEDAARFIAMEKRFPHEPAGPHFAKAAASNPWVFKDKNGRFRTFGEISGMFDAKMERLTRTAHDIAPDFLCQAASHAPADCLQDVTQNEEAAASMQRFKSGLTSWQPSGNGLRLRL